MPVRPLFLFLLLMLLPAPAAAGPVHDVLVLQSYHMGYGWTDGVMTGMKEVLDASGDEMRLQVEYLDAKRFHDPEYLAEVLALVLTHKLQRLSFDLVLVADTPALDFVLDHRAQLFPNTPVLFCGINQFRPEMIAGVADITGVAEYPDYRETLRLALQFHPGTREVIFTANTGNVTDREIRRGFLRVLEEFSDRVRFTLWDDVPFEDLLQKVREAGPETVFFLTGLILDRQGRSLGYPETTRAIREATDLPLYSAWDFYLGHGIVGGRLVSSRRQGEMAARLGLRVLHGEDADAIPVVTEGTNVYMFDDRELRRFGIPSGLLPAESDITNRPPPFLALDREQTAWFLALTAALVLLLIFLAVNILRRRRAEKALRESEERFRAIADYTHDWEGWIGPDGRLRWVNPSVERFTGFSVDECLAMPDYPLPIIHEDDREELARVVADALQTRASGSNYPFRIRRKDGAARWMAVSWQPIFDSRGAYIGVRASVRDITERQKMIDNLQAANQELDAFVHTVSHDLRTPLTPIIGYAEFLRRQYEGELDHTALWSLEQIEQTGHRMLQMLEDLLALARVGHLEEPTEAVDSASVLQAILGDLGTQIAETGTSVTVGPMPVVMVPRSFLAQALENLLGNAVRYAGGPGRPIEVGGELQGERARFYVRDHGEGIEDAEKKRIFDLFYRTPAVCHRAGTGVGLATVRRIARRCGGRVWVEDTPGGGATFWLELQNRMPAKEVVR